MRDPHALPVRLSSIQLARFAKVLLSAGETKEVTIKLAAHDLGYWDDGRNGVEGVPAAGGWRVDPGKFELFVTTDGFKSWKKPSGLAATVKVLK